MIKIIRAHPTILIGKTIWMNNVDTKLGTLAGTVLSISMTMNIENVLETVFLAIVGASTSFLISVILKKIFRNKNNS